jgi:DNA replication protein DnaC
MDTRPQPQVSDHIQREITAAMLDRLVHHAEVISMKGDSYRLKDRDLGRVPAATKTDD